MPTPLTRPERSLRFSLGLPVERPDRFEELGSGPALAELAAAAEDAGYDAVSVTDHPFPPARWLRSGGHHTHEPLVALAYVAGATRTIRLHTNVFVAAYRNPYLAAKGVASLDALSGGRLILGVAAGYLEGEFAALGADFARRNEVLDETIAAMRRAWSGSPVAVAHPGGETVEHVMLPPPVQAGGPPIWVGGNSTRAIRRAAELGDGWMPFPQPKGASKYTRTPNIETVDDLRGRIGLARRLAEEAGRTEPLDVCFVPFGLTLFDLADSSGGRREPDLAAVADSAAELAEAGVTWLSIAFPAEDRAGFRRWIDRFAAEVIEVVGTSPGAS